MSDETNHLLCWWKIWFVRLTRTTYHLVNRRAYRKWKDINCRPKHQRLDGIELDEFGDGIC